MTVESNVAPRRSSRQRVGGLAAACWGLLIVLKLLREGVGWTSHGVPYWIVYAPLAAGFVVAGVLWMVLSVRDVVASRHARPSVTQALSGGHRTEIPAAASEFSAVEIVQEDKITRRAWREAREAEAHEG